MNKEQIVEYLENNIASLTVKDVALTPHGESTLMIYRDLLTKIKEEPKPVELEVGGYYCDLEHPKHKFRVLTIEGSRYYYIGFDDGGYFELKDWFLINRNPKGLRHLTPDEIKEIDQRSMSGKEVTVIIDDVEHTAVIK